jgi:predicted alpha/beta-fold hydrolase
MDSLRLLMHSLSNNFTAFSAPENILFISTALGHVLIGRFHHYSRAEPRIICHQTEKNKILLSNCKALYDFKPSPLYALDYYGLLQTVGQTVLKSLGRALSGIRYTRELYQLSDGGTVALDWVTSVDGHAVTCPTDAHTVVIQHGLCGDSNVEYVIHLAEALSRLQYRVAVMIARGCGGVKLTTHIPFSFGQTLDFKEVIDHVHRLHPQSKLLAVGYSLGACLTLRHMAIHAEDTPLSAALCVSPPWDFGVATTFMFRAVWTKVLVSLMKTYYWFNREAMDPELLAQIYGASEMTSYDDIVAPLLGHATRHQYYEASSPKFVTNKITMPTLAISSVDDPVCNIAGAPQDISSGQVGSGLIIAIVELGGHLGFAEDWLPFRTSWVDRVCIDWFENILKLEEEEEQGKKY